MTIMGYQRSDSKNVFGYIASAIQGNGMSSFGNGTKIGTSVLKYISEQSSARDQQITIILSNKEQDAAAKAQVSSYTSDKVGTLSDTCASRTSEVLNGAGIPVESSIFPKNVQTEAMKQPGAVTYTIKKDGEIPKDLIKAIEKFERIKED